MSFGREFQRFPPPLLNEPPTRFTTKTLEKTTGMVPPSTASFTQDSQNEQTQCEEQNDEMCAEDSGL